MYFEIKSNIDNVHALAKADTESQAWDRFIEKWKTERKEAFLCNSKSRLKTPEPNRCDYDVVPFDLPTEEDPVLILSE